MPKAMISQPMGNKTDAEILAERDAAKQSLESLGYEIVDTFFQEEFGTGNKHRPLYFLAKSLMIMSECDAVYFVKGWNSRRGCKIEHDICMEYGLKAIYQE